MDQRISFPNTPLTLASAKSGAKRIRGKLTIGMLAIDGGLSREDYGSKDKLP
jgi:hypothetical protein